MKRREAHALFVAGLDYLNRRSILHRVDAAGMSPSTLHRLTLHLAARASHVIGAQVLIERVARRPWKRSVLLQTIDRALHRGAPVIIGLEGTHDHYTVVVGITADRYRLFYSSALQGIARDGPRFRDPSTDNSASAACWWWCLLWHTVDRSG